MENLFPTSRGADLRHGSAQVSLVNGRVTALMPFSDSGVDKIVAATETTLTAIDDFQQISSFTGDITHGDGSFFDDDAGYALVALDPDVTGLSGGAWSHTQFANSSGQYLYMVNGPAYTYDGSSITLRSITGPTGSLSAVWNFAKRLFFVEENTQSAWYLAPNAISGAATEFPLQGVFTLGGSLLFGASWSLDSGAGLDDKCVFVTDQGEVAVYSGGDPSSNFSLEGVYQIGKPLTKTGWFKSGGDLAIMTEEGIVPVSAAIRVDRAALSQEAITYPIEDAWLDAVAMRTTANPFGAVFWRAQNQLVVHGILEAGSAVQFVANAQTGAWCKYKGWDMQAGCTVGGRMYFGDTEGRVFLCDVGGMDNGEPITASYVPRFDNIGNVSQKEAVHARVVARSSANVSPAIFANSDYVVVLPDSVDGTMGGKGAAWGSATWGSFVWGGSAPTVAVQQWQSVNALGSALSPGVQIKSSGTEAWDFEIVGMDLVYHQGDLV